MMGKPRVLVTRRWPDAVEARLAERYNVVFNRSDRPLTQDDFRGAFQSFDAVLPTVTDRLGPQAMDVSRAQTKILANYGAGYTHIDLAGAQTHGIAVTNTPDVLSRCTADLAMALMLMVARRAGDGERALRAGQWGGPVPTQLVGTQVSGKTLGLVGFGRIGKEMARRAHFGFGMKIVIFNRSPVPAEVLASFDATQADTLDDMLGQCDFVSLHCPGGAENRKMINGARLEMMKQGAYLINTAHGDLVDEAALAQALMFDMIGGAALDVFECAPHVNPLLAQCDNLVMLPHMGSATVEARKAMGFRVLENLEAFFDGRTPRDRVA